MVRSNFDCFRRRLEEIQWDFANVENSGIHLLHWYPATFVAAIPGSLVPILTRTGETVLDPFCGSGVCGVETVRLGRRFLGFDINPVGVLITQAKLLMVSPSKLLTLRRSVQAVKNATGNLFGGRKILKLTEHPNREELARWYHPQTLEDLLRIHGIVETLHDPQVRTVGRCLFSSILKNVCSQGKHWGWVCDNVTPKPEELQPKDASDAFLNALDIYERGITDLARDMVVRGVDHRQLKRGSDWDAQCGDALALMKSLPDGTVSSIITSPPYYGVADYVKSQRLTFLWFHRGVATLDNCESGDFEHLRSLEVGSRSFRHRAEGHNEYLAYFSVFFGEVRRLLKAGGTLCFIVGESSSRPETVQSLKDSAIQHNLVEIYSSTRGIRATRRRISARLPGENVLVYQKS